MHAEREQSDRRRVVAHAKLVRDRIPDIIRAEGSQPMVRVLEPAEYATQLRRKLSEEVQEYLAAVDTTDAAAIEELADVLELLYALAATHGATESDLHATQRAKRAARGAFAERIFLDSVLLAPAPGAER